MGAHRARLDRNNSYHDQWLRNRIRSYYERGAFFFTYEDCLREDMIGVVAVLHEKQPEGIEALGARAEAHIACL